jgi:uncharacterized DUF497 family protein
MHIIVLISVRKSTNKEQIKQNYNQQNRSSYQNQSKTKTNNKKKIISFQSQSSLVASVVSVASQAFQ